MILKERQRYYEALEGFHKAMSSAAHGTGPDAAALSALETAREATLAARKEAKKQHKAYNEALRKLL